jgi:purine-nucleoside phosphorylase
MLNQISETAEFIRSKLPIGKLDAGIILGTGLGGFAKHIQSETELSYKDIPNFPQSTVQGHEGKLIHGFINGKEVIAMKGRFHFYEGYSMEQVVFPVRVMKSLGIQNLILSNASGGMNPDFKVGDIMIIKDHINLFPTNPLLGKNHDQLGPRFPDMSEPYSHAYINLLQECSVELQIPVRQGVYAGVSGPCFETPAEYKYLRIIGADAVGMSTVPENIAAIHQGMKVAALSVITDLGVEGIVDQVSHEEVQKAANAAEPKMADIVKLFLTKLS